MTFRRQMRVVLPLHPRTAALLSAPDVPLRFCAPSNPSVLRHAGVAEALARIVL
jgi:hypothetical protein